MPRENETGEKAVLDAAIATAAVYSGGVIRAEISLAAKTLPIVDVSEYITRCVVRSGRRSRSVLKKKKRWSKRGGN